MFFGDGASNEGSFHEAYKHGGIMEAPYCFSSAITTSMECRWQLKKHMTVHHISQRAAAFNIPGVTVDGNDVFAVYNKVSEL